jgi:uncharacterized membrane protein YfcA
MKTALFVALGLFAGVFVLIWVLAVARSRSDAATGHGRPTPLQISIGFITNFFDTLGIGSFATTSAFFRISRVVPDEQFPGTLNVGHCIPSILQAFIYIAVVQVGMTTLILMISASVLGAWLGAGIVSAWPRRKVQVGMGIALLAAATAMLMTQFALFPGGGDHLELSGIKLVAAVMGNFVLGALMTLGIGIYAPCMILVSLLGMNPTAAFPIMMGSCAFLMPVASIPFIRRGSYNLKAAVGLTLGGVPAVLLAAFLVRSLPLAAVRWLVIVVVVYTAAMMLRSAFVEAQATSPPKLFAARPIDRSAG